jgi:hypothetical protein
LYQENKTTNKTQSIMENINTNEFSKEYSKILLDLYKIRKRQEDFLTNIVKKYQKSSEEGIDIRELGVSVGLDGYEGHLVYAIRTVSEEGYDYLELKIMTVDANEYEWLCIYDFYTDTIDKILSEIMENI